MRLTAEEKAILQTLRENGATKEELNTLTNLAKMIIEKRKGTH